MRPKTPKNRRASPDAIEKRRAARRFNEILQGEGARAPDGRTERRRKRLLDELSSGKSRGGTRELKPIDVLVRVDELLTLGEPLASIQKVCPKVRPIEPTDEVIDGLRALHRAYGFPVEVYRFVGVDADTLARAGISAAKPGLKKTAPRRGRRAA